MFQKMTEPLIIFAVVVLGTLALSVVLGTIDACVSKGPKPTLSIRVGAMCMAAFLPFPPGPALTSEFDAAATTSRYTLWSKVFCSIGGCWEVIGPVVTIVYLALLVIFT